EAQHELEGTLPETEGLGRQELAALQGATGQAFANLVHVAQPETLHLRLPGCRQQLLRMADEAVYIDFTALDLLVERRAFLHQHPGNENDRQHRHQQADEQGGKSCQVPPSIQAGEQTTLYRGEDDRQDHGPEHRTVERKEYPAKGPDTTSNRARNTFCSSLELTIMHPVAVVVPFSQRSREGVQAVALDVACCNIQLSMSRIRAPWPQPSRIPAAAGCSGGRSVPPYPRYGCAGHPRSAPPSGPASSRKLASRHRPGRQRFRPG